MKKIFVYIGILIGLCSCSFLEEQPIDRLVVDNFYSSQKDAQAAVDACYQQLNSLHNRNMYLLCDLPTDVMKNGLGMPNAFLQDLEFLRHTSENTFIKDMWNNLYAGIMKTNAAINNIPPVIMDEDVKNRFIGEAKFLRALYYFNAVRFWGDVPVVLKLETVNDALGPRVPQEQVYEQIIADLNDAIKVLPKSYDDANVGRATQGAARILLGKVYLTKHDFENAKAALSVVVDHESDYGYGLHKDYAANWDPATEAGMEAVFYLEYKPSPSPSNGEMGLAGPKYSIIEGTLGVANSNEADIPTLELSDSYLQGDTRKDVNLRTEFINPSSGELIQTSIPLFGKYWQDGITAPALCEINTHVIRYSDAILMYAEALNELGESNKAHDLLNRVRERAFGDASHNYTGLSKEEFREKILHERFLEFPLEGQRWFDLVRTNTFVQRMKEHSAYEANVAEKNKVDIATNIKDHMILMPIPRRELDLNPELTQNPGWD